MLRRSALASSRAAAGRRPLSAQRQAVGCGCGVLWDLLKSRNRLELTGRLPRHPSTHWQLVDF